MEQKQKSKTVNYRRKFTILSDIQDTINFTIN